MTVFVKVTDKLVKIASSVIKLILLLSILSTFERNSSNLVELIKLEKASLDAAPFEALVVV